LQTSNNFKVDGFTIKDYVIDVFYYAESDTESRNIELDYFAFWDWCDKNYRGKGGYTIDADQTGENLVDVDFQDWWDAQEQTPIIEKYVNHQFSDGPISKQSIEALKEALSENFNGIDAVGFPHLATEIITAARELGLKDLADEMKADLS